MGVPVRVWVFLCWFVWSLFMFLFSCGFFRWGHTCRYSPCNQRSFKEQTLRTLLCQMIPSLCGRISLVISCDKILVWNFLYFSESFSNSHFLSFLFQNRGPCCCQHHCLVFQVILCLVFLPFFKWRSMFKLLSTVFYSPCMWRFLLFFCFDLFPTFCEALFFVLSTKIKIYFRSTPASQSPAHLILFSSPILNSTRRSSCFKPYMYPRFQISSHQCQFPNQ